MSGGTPQVLWAPWAWLPSGWRENVVLRVGPDGRWADVCADQTRAPEGATVDVASIPSIAYPPDTAPLDVSSCRRAMRCLPAQRPR